MCWLPLATTEFHLSSWHPSAALHSYLQLWLFWAKLYCQQTLSPDLYCFPRLFMNVVKNMLETFFHWENYLDSLISAINFLFWECLTSLQVEMFTLFWPGTLLVHMLIECLKKKLWGMIPFCRNCEIFPQNIKFLLILFIILVSSNLSAAEVRFPNLSFSQSSMEPSGNTPVFSLFCLLFLQILRKNWGLGYRPPSVA